MLSIACLAALVAPPGCASSRSSAPNPALRAGHPVVASLEPAPSSPPAATDAASPDATTAPAEAAPLPDEDVSAAELLQRGFAFFHDDKPALAGASFRAAIATGNLNDAGRALAYWHVYLAERTQGHTELGADALESFLAAGQEVMDARESPLFSMQGGADFVERFDLDRRMTRARALLSAVWAARIATFGRSANRPVPVRSDSEVEDFLEHAPPCADAPDRQTSRQPVVADNDTTLEQVTLRCHDRRDTTDYWFEKSEDQQ